MKASKTILINNKELLLSIIIFVLFLAVSLPGIRWGAPALWNPDELVWRVDSALRGELIFDVSEPDYNYPSLPKYVMYAIGSITYGLGKSNFAFIVAARVFSAVLGGLSGVLIYHLARLIGLETKSAVLAAIFYIVSGTAAANGRFAHNDLYLQLFTILCVYCIIKYQQSGINNWLYGSFLAVGLAASSKYTGGSLILLPALVCFISGRQPLWKRLGIIAFGGFISYIGYAIGTPKAFVEPVHYFLNVIPALQNYPQYGFNSGASIGLWGQWAVFKSAVGIFCYYFFLLSLLWFIVKFFLWKTKRITMKHQEAGAAGILLGVILIFDLPFMISINYIERYFIPFIPFLAILAAITVKDLISFTRNKNLKFAQYAFTAIVMVGIGYSILRLASIALLFMNDARIPASEYIASIHGFGKSIEYTLYPPMIDKKRFSRAHNYPIYFVKYPGDIVPTGGRHEYNKGEQGLLERNTDYFVIDSYTYQRFYTQSICDTNVVECDFFKRLLDGEVTTYQLEKEFSYNLPPYLPKVFISAVNPYIKIYQRAP